MTEKPRIHVCKNNSFEQYIIDVEGREYKHTESEPSKAIYIIFAIALGAILGILRFMGL